MHYRITISVKDVALADVEPIAQQVWDDYAEDYDASLGDFSVRVSTVEGNATFDAGWTPKEAA